MDDRRQFRRWDANGEVEVTVDERPGAALRGELADISFAGAGVALDEMLPVGTLVGLRVASSDGLLACDAELGRGRVVGAEAKGASGTFFNHVQLTEIDEMQMEALVMRLQRAQTSRQRTISGIAASGRRRF